jgi:spermidine synthase
MVKGLVPFQDSFPRRKISIGSKTLVYYNPSWTHKGKDLLNPFSLAMVSFSLLLGIFLNSAATLTLEISLIRLLSVAQGYHFAFMVVSMALLGYGASGSFLSSFPSLMRRETPQTLIRASGLFSFSALAAYLLSNLIPFDTARISWDRWQIFYVFLYYLVFSIPFFFSGLAISSALARWSILSGKLYFSDLTGASLGCLLVLGLFGIFGGPGTLLFACLLGGLASIAFAWASKPISILRWSWVCFLTLLLLWQPPFLDLRLSPYKALNAALLFPGARLLETHWNVFSRVDILESPAARTAPGLSLQYLEPLPPQLGLTVDADHLNAITRFSGKPGEKDELRFIDFLPSSFPYQMAKPERVLIFEPMGGLEILNALHHRSREIVVTEVNPEIVKLLQGTYHDYSGGIYSRPGIQVAVGDGRGYVRGAPPAFDLIVLSLTESLGASATGLSSLHEDYRLTAEAFQDYLQALKPGGFLSISLYLLPPPRAELRLVSVTKETLERAGKRPGDYLLAYRSWSTFSLLVKKGPIESQEIKALKSFCQRLRFDLVYYPGMSEGEANVYNRFPTPIYFGGVQKVLRDGEKFYSTYPFDLSPATDDRPFFHHYFRWGHLGEIYRLAGEKWQILVEGGYLVPIVFIQALFLSFLFILLPLIFGKLGKKRPKVPGGHPGSWLIFFSALGLGFMFVEISLMQEFILFLSHPVYSVSLVLFSLLIFAGAGSRLSMRIDPRSSRGLKLILPSAAGILFLYAFFLPQVLQFFQGKPLFFRQMITVLLIAPSGLLLGMPFPLAIRWVGSRWPFLVPWAWCANGCASVLGSILPVIIALSWGFQAVFFLASLLYGASWLVVLRS